jgi:DNA-binding FrmR family transcriptional regulator
MLANRADTYNLGDILGGKEDAFALSYIENALTSNPVLAPLATREPGRRLQADRMARARRCRSTELSPRLLRGRARGDHGGAPRLIRCSDVLSRQPAVHRSRRAGRRLPHRAAVQAAGQLPQHEQARREGRPAMNDEELEQLIDDHYLGESQTLTTGAEQNLLKLAELRGKMTDEQKARWEQVKRDFNRVKLMGGATDDPISRVTGQLGGLTDKLEGIQLAMRENTTVSERLAGIEAAVHSAATLMQERAAEQKVRDAEAAGDEEFERDRLLVKYMQHIEDALHALSAPKLEVKVQNQAPAGVEELLAQQIAIIERTLVPLVRTTSQNLGNPSAIDAHVLELLALMRSVDERLREGRTGVFGS